MCPKMYADSVLICNDGEDGFTIVDRQVMKTQMWATEICLRSPADVVLEEQ